MHTPAQFRFATAADFPALVALVNRAYRGLDGPTGWTAENHLLSGPRTDAAELGELLAAPGAAILLAPADGALLGCVYVRPQATALYIGLLAVDPARQTSGLGKQLLAAAEDHGRRHGFGQAKMTVLAARPELLAWYARRGYHDTGRSLPFPHSPRSGTPTQELTLRVLRKALTP